VPLRSHKPCTRVSRSRVKSAISYITRGCASARGLAGANVVPMFAMFLDGGRVAGQQCRCGAEDSHTPTTYIKHDGLAGRFQSLEGQLQALGRCARMKQASAHWGFPGETSTE
jgi:hypothetical protein